MKTLFIAVIVLAFWATLVVALSGMVGGAAGFLSTTSY